ncbi:MAG: AAA family ATPase [Selenomonadaceae bacterium]|nr:AAA family ATPase [Selenomonadaceae bacterium]
MNDNTTNKLMPVGIDDFRQLIVKRFCFIDKTRFIKEILDGQGGITLITRPRRFGKTLNMSMLYYFFTLRDKEKNRDLFTGLDIEKAGGAYMAEQGSRPVIFLTLKGGQAPEYALMLEYLQELLRVLYGQFRYLLESVALAEDDKQYFERIIAKTANRSEVQVSLQRLMALLKKHHGREAVLLLDEYDAPIIRSWERGYYEDCIDFMRGFLSEALKSNEALDFAVLTGVTRVSKESIFSGLNNLRVCSVLSERYSDIFGFTQAEVDGLLQVCGLTDKREDLKRWYDGYTFGHEEIYNPWSVISFIDNDCKYKPYWLNTSGNSILKTLLARIDTRKAEDLQSLIQGKPLNALVRENISYADLSADCNTLYMMLLTAGYLKAVKTWQDDRSREWVALEIPNLEINQAYENEILDNIAPHQGQIVLEDMLTAMTEGRGTDFARFLEELLRDFVSYHDSSHQPETFYHGLLLGLAVWFTGKYRVESNRESGYGRFDLAFFPLKENAPGVILELKTVKKEREMEKAAQAALKQIKTKAYETELTRQGVKTVWRYGVAFCGKKMRLAGGA